MSKVYQVRITSSDPSLQGQVLQQSTSVYADTEAEARTLGASTLGVAKDRVSVQEIPGAVNPSDAELLARFESRGY